MSSGNFKKGHVPWNKGKKGIHLSPETEFKKGERAGDKNNSWKGGVQTTKNDCTYLYAGVNKRVRRPVSVYQQAYGEIPKGWVVIHLDGNKDNDEIDNLIAIPRAILIKLNAGRTARTWYNLQQEVVNYLIKIKQNG